MDLKFFKTKKKFKKGGLHTDPNIYWDILLTIVFIIIIASFVYGFFFFRDMNLEFNLSVPEGNTQAEKISKVRMDKVLGYFLTRNEKSKSVILNPALVVDPSL